MTDFSFDKLDVSFKTLKLDITSTEMAAFAEEQGLNNSQLEALQEVFDYLHHKKIQTTIDTMLRMSRLPLKNLKTFDNFDFSVLKGRDVEKLESVSSLSALYAHRNLAFIGPAGTGKTHLAQAFGYECCKRGFKTYFIKMTELRDRFDTARRSGRESKVLNGLIRYSCLIIDEVGHCDFDKENTRLFFDLIDRRCNSEKNSSIIFTSNKNPARWRENFNDEDSLLCALDRIFDDATVYKLRGKSYRGKRLETVTLEVGSHAQNSSSETPPNK